MTLLCSVHSIFQNADCKTVYNIAVPRFGNLVIFKKMLALLNQIIKGTLISTEFIPVSSRPKFSSFLALNFYPEISKFKHIDAREIFEANEGENSGLHLYGQFLPRLMHL